MLAAIGYRGPDAIGEFRDEHIHLLAARLAIVGLEGGNPPVTNEDGSIICALNGEIYNCGALRQNLADRGHRLASTCDTDILPHLYEESVNDPGAFLQRLRGMFAIAIWDRNLRRLVLARDRIGIKPLYIAQTRDYWLFASEAKAILASGLVPRAIDPRSVDNLFTFTYPLPPRTMFAGIRHLEPACYSILKMDIGKTIDIGLSASPPKTRTFASQRVFTAKDFANCYAMSSANTSKVTYRLGRIFRGDWIPRRSLLWLKSNSEAPSQLSLLRLQTPLSTNANFRALPRSLLAFRIERSN